MAIDPVLFRTPMLSPNGQLTREWIRFFQELGTAATEVQNILNTTAGAGQASAFDDTPVHDTKAETTQAILAAVNEPTQRAPLQDLNGLFLPGDTSILGALGTAAFLDSTKFAQLALSNTFTASQTIQAQSLTLTNNFAAGAVGYLQLISGVGSPRSGRLSFGTDGTGWSFVISKNQGGTITDVLTMKDDLSVTVAGALNAASIGATSLSGTLNLNAQAISGASLGSITVGRAANFASAAAIWSCNVLNSAGSDNVSLGQSSSTYSSGLIQWIGNSNAFLYFNSTQDFRIGSGIGATPIMTVKGAGRVLLGTLTDDTVNKLQVTGGLSTNALTVTTPASITLGSGWIAYTPTFTAAGSMTVSGLTITEAVYLRIGPIVFFRIFASFTLGGTASNSVIFTLPVTVAGQVGAYTLNVHAFGANWTPGYGLINNTDSTGRAGLTGEPVYPLGSTIISAEGFYSC